MSAADEYRKLLDDARNTMTGKLHISPRQALDAADAAIAELEAEVECLSGSALYRELVAYKERQEARIAELEADRKNLMRRLWTSEEKAAGLETELAIADDRYKAKAECLKGYSHWTGVPNESFVNICKLGSVFDEIVERDNLNCLAVRCWLELQQQLRISPCVLMSELNERGIAAACETDIGSAVSMRALSLATGTPPACLDWNNNFNDDPEKCIVFHCGPVPQSMMQDRGQIEDHQILAKVVGTGCSFGCNVGRMKPSPMTYGNLMSEDGRLRMYLGEGEFTADPVPKEFFGTAGVVKIKNLQDVLCMIGNEGFRHHVAIAHGLAREPLAEALQKYLGFEIIHA